MNRIFFHFSITIIFSLIITREILSSFGYDSLATQWNLDSRSETATNVTRVISQAASYASIAGIKYFAISTYNVTWFCRATAPGAFLITRGYPSNAQSPSVMQMLWHMTVKALSEDRLPAWTPVMIPKGDWKKRQPGRRSSDSVIVTEPATSSADEIGQDGSARSSTTPMPSFEDFHPSDMVGHGMSGNVFRGR